MQQTKRDGEVSFVCLFVCCHTVGLLFFGKKSLSNNMLWNWCSLIIMYKIDGEQSIDQKKTTTKKQTPSPLTMLLLTTNRNLVYITRLVMPKATRHYGFWRSFFTVSKWQIIISETGFEIFFKSIYLLIDCILRKHRHTKTGTQT